MILQLRIDERLIHGQIAAAWGKALPLSAIVCASDVAVNDSIRTKMLLMAAPPETKARIKNVDGAIKLLADPRADKMKVLLITDCPESALKLVENLQISEVNVANYHCSKDSPDQIRVFDTCLATKKDVEILKEIAGKVTDIYSQMIPSSPKRDVREFLAAL